MMIEMMMIMMMIEMMMMMMMMMIEMMMVMMMVMMIESSLWARNTLGYAGIESTWCVAVTCMDPSALGWDFISTAMLSTSRWRPSSFGPLSWSTIREGTGPWAVLVLTLMSRMVKEKEEDGEEDEDASSSSSVASASNMSNTLLITPESNRCPWRQIEAYSMRQGN